MAASTDDLLPRLRAYREQITQLLIEGELSNLESAQAEILATLTNGSDSVRGRREVQRHPREESPAPIA